MKKTAFLMALLLCLSQFAACNGDSSDSGDTTVTTNGDGTSAVTSAESSDLADSQVAKFINFIKEGEYLKAVECYNDELYGNYEYELEASEGVENLLKELNSGILSGEKSEKDSKKLTGAVDNVLAQTNMSVEGYDELKASINESVASKAAFLAAKELESLKQYADAIAEYKKVLETDSNYKDATDSIATCTEAYKQSVFAEAVSLAESDKYIDAIAKLKGLAEVLPDDSEVSAKLTVYEKTYISNTITAAEAAFVTPATDYTAALDIINAALQYFPENEDLKAKKSYYESFTPVNLYDMEEIKGSAITKANDEDIYGNEYAKCFRNNCDLSYHLDKKYNTFKATIYVLSKKNYTEYMTAEIYADGNIIYRNLKISDNSTQPFVIELDVTGAEELRIVLDDGDSIAANHFGITNMMIQRTAK